MQPILHNIHLELNEGEITCLLGKSGCGKSTLLQLCAGLLLPQSGRIHSTIQRPGQYIGYMQQSGGLLPWRTIYQNIALGLELTNRPIDDDKITRLLEQLGLLDKKHVFPHELSGGQKQRVSLAQQLILEPKLLLLDEPLTALDVVLRQEIAQLIKDQIKQRGISALIITHSIDEAVFLADQVCILQNNPASIASSWRTSDKMSSEHLFTAIADTLRSEAVHA